MKYTTRFATTFLVVIAVSLGLSIAKVSRASGGAAPTSWRTAPQYSAGIAPDPVDLADTAIVQVYIAPTYGWRAYLAVHSWIIFKKTGETAYTRYDVVGWRGTDVVQRDYALPDGLWYGARPKLLVDLRGKDVDAMIGQIEAAIASYPYGQEYRAYPGPNSNTFIAHIGREVAALKLDLPANAIGKDYRSIKQAVGLSSSGSGVQATLLGLLGVNLGWQEGLEINVLGLDFGLDLNSPGLRLPFIGRIGFDDTSRGIKD